MILVFGLDLFIGFDGKKKYGFIWVELGVFYLIRKNRWIGSYLGFYYDDCIFYFVCIDNNLIFFKFLDIICVWDDI